MQGQRLSWEILDAFQKGASEFGIKPTNHFNNSNEETCGYFQVGLGLVNFQRLGVSAFTSVIVIQVNQRNGVRLSAYRAFLKPVMKRPNLHVITHAHTRRVLLQNGKAIGMHPLEFRNQFLCVLLLLARRPLLLSST
jgi:choline dehydrogenase